ncbi:MAG TPA: MaoC family dehydratase [Gemmatimonadales bacterium]|jgi:3-hydroxybutyryl-CoA dehydratase|nr:MaoC family dehydratase [Gemmatimonadales bacterium]
MMRFDELFLGQSASVTKVISDDEMRRFAELTGDFSAMHFDDAFANESRFGGRIAHGLLSASLFSAVLGMHLPGTGTIYRGQSLRFLLPVRPGDTIVATAEVTVLVPEKRRVTLRTTCTNQRGEMVIDGEAQMLMLA